MSALDNIIGAGASALGSGIVGTGLGVISNTFGSSNQKKMMDYQNKLQMDNWNNQFAQQNARQDALNKTLPATQVQALKNAGLNPAMMQGGFSGNSASASSPITPSSNIPSPTTNLADMIRVVQSSQLTGADIALKGAQEGAAIKQGNLAQTQSDLLQKDIPTREGINQATLDNLLSQKAVSDEQARYLSSQTENNQLLYDFNLKSFDDRLQAIKNENAVTYQTYLKLQEDTKLLTMQNEWYPRLMQSEINLKASQVHLNEANRKEALANVDKINFYLKELGPQERKETIQRIENLCQTHDLAALEVKRIEYENEVYQTVSPKVRAIFDLTFDALDRVGGFIGHTAGAVSGLKNAATNRNNSNRTTTTTTTNNYDKNGKYSGGSRSTQRKR